MALGNIDGLIRRIIRIRRKNSQGSDKSNGSSNSSNLKGKSIIILGIAMAVIGFVGAIYYGSQFVKEEVNAGAALPYTTPSQIKNILPMDLEIVFVVIGIIGFGIFTYGFATRVGKPLDFYPTWDISRYLNMSELTGFHILGLNHDGVVSLLLLFTLLGNQGI